MKKSFLKKQERNLFKDFFLPKKFAQSFGEFLFYELYAAHALLTLLFYYVCHFFLKRVVAVRWYLW